MWKMITLGWAQDSWNTTLLPHHQPIRRKSHTLQPSPQILSLKTLPWKPLGNVGLLSMSHLYSLLGPCNKPFSVLNFHGLACLPSLCMKHTNLGLTTFFIYTKCPLWYPTLIRSVIGPIFPFQLDSNVAKCSCKYHGINISICYYD